MAERRGCARFDYRREINYSDGERLYQGVIGNVSEGGMFIHTSDSLRPGTRIALYAGLPRNDAVVESVIVRAEPTGIGLAFGKRRSLDRIMVRESHEMWG